MLLRSMRKGFLSAIFLGLLVLGAFSLILSDTTGTLRGGIGNQDVAKIDDTTITITQFNNQVRLILQSQNIAPSAAYENGLINNILTNEVYSILMKKDAAALGIRVEDKLIANQIKSIIAPLKSEGMTDREALKRFLEMQSLSEKQLVQELRGDMTSKILAATLTTANYVPRDLINTLSQHDSISRDFDFVFFPNSSVAIDKKPTDAELETYYKSISQDYMNPENRDITIATLDTSELVKVKVSDEEARQFYNDNQDSFELPSQAHIEQAVVADKKQADDIIALMKKNDSMADAVESVTKKKTDYQGKTKLTKDGLMETLAEPVFSAKPNDIIGPIQSPLGFHIVRFIEMIPAGVEKFEAVEAKIKQELLEEKKGNALLDISTDIEDRLANGEKFEDIKKEYPLVLTSLKSVTPDTALDNKLGLSEDEYKKILARAFALNDSSPSDLGDLSNTKLFSVRADVIRPSAAKDFSSVKSEILKRWERETKFQNNLIATQKKIDDLSSGALKFSDLKPTNISNLTAQGSDKLSVDVMPRFLASEKGKYILAVSNKKDGIYIGKVNSITLPQSAAKPSDEEVKRIEADITSAGYMSYMDSLQNRYKVEINQKLLERTYGASPTAQE